MHDGFRMLRVSPDDDLRRNSTHSTDNSEGFNRDRLQRVANREFRSLSSSSGVASWTVRICWRPFLMYALYCGGISYMKLGLHIELHEFLLFPPNYRPYLMGVLQLLAAFLTGFSLNEAAARFKTAMTALRLFQEDMDNLRSMLLSSTEDPKFRFAVQVFIAWLVVLMRKNISFFSEDFSSPISDVIAHEFRDCRAFDPEVLWSCDRPQVEFLFLTFLRNAHLDKNKQMMSNYNSAIKAYGDMLNLLMVKSPATKNMLGLVAVHAFLLTIPLVNPDLFTLGAMPFISCIFVAIMGLTQELADPWGDDFHDLPLKEVMAVIAAPVWYEGDRVVASDSLAWLNRGLVDNKWDHAGHSDCGVRRHEIPREKKRGEDKGQMVTFDDFRTLAEVTGHRTYQSFLEEKRKDMEEAEGRGRRMPGYLRWNKIV